VGGSRGTVELLTFCYGTRLLVRLLVRLLGGWKSVATLRCCARPARRSSSLSSFLSSFSPLLNLSRLNKTRLYWNSNK